MFRRETRHFPQISLFWFLFKKQPRIYTILMYFFLFFFKTFCVWYLYCILEQIKLILGSLQQRRLM